VSGQRGFDALRDAELFFRIVQPDGAAADRGNRGKLFLRGSIISAS